MSTATNGRKLRSFRGGDYVASIMAKLEHIGIAQRLQSAREEAGLTQADLADVLHVHWRTIQNWESQSAPIVAWDRLDEIAGALGVTKTWLMHGPPEEPAEPLEVQAALLRDVASMVESLEISSENVLQLLADLRVRLERIEGVLEQNVAPQNDPHTSSHPVVHN